jgi:hypothetical protein
MQRRNQKCSSSGTRASLRGNGNLPSTAHIPEYASRVSLAACLEWDDTHFHHTAPAVGGCLRLQLRVTRSRLQLRRMAAGHGPRGDTRDISPRQARLRIHHDCSKQNDCRPQGNTTTVQGGRHPDVGGRCQSLYLACESDRWIAARRRLVSPPDSCREGTVVDITSHSYRHSNGDRQ